MKKLKFILVLVTCIAAAISACKKEEENPQAFVQEHIIGKWPIKYQIRTTFTNNVETKADTLITYNPIDTLVFTPEGKAIRQNKAVISSVDYTISADGETITFSNTPVSTLKITFVRNTSIGLGVETITQNGGKEIRTVLADHLIK